MQQVTNVCNNVGASNGANHCDVSYLYDEEMFGRKYKKDETTEIMEVDLNNYRNVPVNSICSGALNTLTGFYVAFASAVEVYTYVDVGLFGRTAHFCGAFPGKEYFGNLIPCHAVAPEDK